MTKVMGMVKPVGTEETEMNEPAAGDTSGRPSPFWTFSLSVYGRPGVSAACLRLQDEHGADVNLVLCTLWLATRGRAVEAADIAALGDLVAPWCADVVMPLRRVRRVLKSPPDGFGTDATARLRERLKAVELESERLEQEALAVATTATPPGRAAPAGADLLGANLAAYAESIGAELPGDAVATLLAAAAAALSDGSAA